MTATGLNVVSPMLSSSALGAMQANVRAIGEMQRRAFGNPALEAMQANLKAIGEMQRRAFGNPALEAMQANLKAIGEMQRRAFGNPALEAMQAKVVTAAVAIAVAAVTDICEPENDARGTDARCTDTSPLSPFGQAFIVALLGLLLLALYAELQFHPAVAVIVNPVVGPATGVGVPAVMIKTYRRAKQRRDLPFDRK